jgi:cytochrome c oxidase subunit 3
VRLLIWATQAARRGDRRGMQAHLTANAALGIAALILRIHNLYHVGVTWNANIYGSVVWIMLCFHTFDYVAALIESVAFSVIAFGGRLGLKQRIGIEVDSLTWYFVVAIWIPLYALIYILSNAH